MTNRRLSLDDGFLLFAFLNLIGGTVVFYAQIHLLFLEWGATQGDFLITLLALRRMDDFFEMSKWRIAYFFFLWTTIFAVKGCYLAFFRPFLRARGRAIQYYYWFVVGLSAVSWVLLVIGDSAIVCPHVGKASSESSLAVHLSGITLTIFSQMCTQLVGNQSTRQCGTLAQRCTRCLHRHLE
jgi:hypothetical protein